MKRSDNYASNQIRLFLGDLKIGNHASKLKALQKFQSYIEQNKPEVMWILLRYQTCSHVIV